MITGTVQGFLTLVLMLLFIGVWAWSWSSRRHGGFRQASLLPLEEDERAEDRGAEP